MSNRNATAAAIMIDTERHATFCATDRRADQHVCAPEFAPDYLVDAHTLGLDSDGTVFLRQDEHGNDRIPGLYGAMPTFDPATGRASVNLHTIGEDDNLQALFTPATARLLAAQLVSAANAAEAAQAVTR